jgi:protein involved in polysaccharide export with SLBB domain
MNILKKLTKKLIYFILTISFFITFPLNIISQENAYIIGQNDVINLTIFAGGEIQHNEELTVSSQGEINAPFIGIVKAEGLTPSQLEQMITEPLAKDFFVNPKVNISVKQSKLKIYIEGEVKSPNAYDFQPGITALNACIMAGGFSTFAAPNRTKIIRNTGNSVEIIKINLNKVKDGKIPDVELKPGDRIHVPETWL